MGLKDILLCPHYDVEPKRQPALKHSLKNTATVAIAMDNCAALEVKGYKFRILSSRDGAKAHKAYWRKGEYFVEDINPSTQYAPISSITN